MAQTCTLGTCLLNDKKFQMDMKSCYANLNAKKGNTTKMSLFVKSQSIVYYYFDFQEPVLSLVNCLSCFYCKRKALLFLLQIVPTKSCEKLLRFLLSLNKKRKPEPYTKCYLKTFSPQGLLGGLSKNGRLDILSSDCSGVVTLQLFPKENIQSKFSFGKLFWPEGRLKRPFQNFFHT